MIGARHRGYPITGGATAIAGAIAGGYASVGSLRQTIVQHSKRSFLEYHKDSFMISRVEK